MKLLSRLAILSVIAVLMAGCGLNLGDLTVETGPTVTETQSVASQGAQAADVNIRLGVGRLDISGGADGLMNAAFTYNVPSWKPEVEYQVTGNRGSLRVAQPSAEGLSIPDAANVDYEWDLRLSNALPLAIDADMGVGEGELNLRGLNLTDLRVTTGVGTSTIDLGGNWFQDFNVRIERGVGKTTLIVPTQVGVELRPRTGLGNVRVFGLVQDGDVYHNSQYGISPVTINIEVLGGVGEIEVRQDQ